MNSEWSMPRRADACLGCQRRFESGETFQAFLYDTSAGYERRDYCLRCGPPATPAPLGVWKSRRADARAKKSAPFDREAIYAFFERLEDAHEPNEVQLRFVLALLLWRKKVLKLERTAALVERETWEFVAPRTDTLHRVVRPDLDEEQLERLSNQLEGLLASGSGSLGVAANDLATENHDE